MPKTPDGGARWDSRPVQSALVRLASFAIPLVASVAAGVLAARLLPEPSGLLQTVVWWLAIIAVSSLVMTGVDRYTKRLLPLAALLKLSMLFPDQAPSRYKFARRISGSKALEAELAKMRQGRTWSDRQQAAETILALVGALGDYDSRTRGHSERTQLFVTLLADELKLKQSDRDRLVWAALVHDIGKLRVPGPVLNKPGKPTDEEWAILRSHPAEGAAICEPLREWLGDWYAAIEQHHERWDGRGYPHGLAGSGIGLAGRIVAVADSYEVMTANRPYKKPMSAEAARQELTKCAGSQFDPEIVRAFLNISLGRLRWVTGPLSWVAQMPFLRPIPNLGQVAGAVSAGVGAVAGVVTLGLAPLLGGQSTAPSASADVRAAPTPAPSTPTPTPTKSPESPTPVAREPERAVAPEPLSAPTSSPSPQVAPNGLPLAVDDEAFVAEDGAVDVAVLDNDSDPDGDGLTVTLAGGPKHGSTTVTADGSFRYRPAHDYAGSDSFTYAVSDGRGGSSTATVRVKVAPRNDAPTAGPDSAELAEDTSATVDVTANDSDVDGDPLFAAVVTGPKHGKVSLSADGTATYVPEPDYAGSDSFSYLVTDGRGGDSTATVSILVTPVNDAPVAVDDAATTAEDGDVVVNVLANDKDVDGDPLTVSIGTAPAKGSVFLAPDGRITYAPVANFAGTDTFSYSVSDGLGGTSTATVTVTVTPLNDPPVAGDDAATVAEDESVNIPVLANDTDLDGDALTPSIAMAPAEGTATVEPDGTVTYVPHGDYAGTDTFTYTVSDRNGGNDTATVTITVTSVPDPPVARPDAFTVEQSKALIGSVLANDSDEDGDVLTVTGTTGAPAGLSVDPSTGDVSWTPTMPGSYSFTYTVTDGTTPRSASVTITVTAGPITSNHAYLNPTNTLEIGKLTLTAPSSPSLVDWDADLNPGFTIRSGGTSETENDPTKFHMWQLDVPSGGLSLNGPVSVDLWTSLEDRANKDLDYSAWLYECDAAGNNCVLLASTVDVHIDDWSTTTTWEKRTVSVGSVSKVIAGGKKLRLRLGFNHSDVWIPLDDAHQSSLVFTTGG